MNAFVNENGILVSFGFMGSDNDNILISVSEEFSMTPGFAQYINGDWVEYLPPVNYKSIHQPIKDQLMGAAMEATQGMSDAFVAGLLSDTEVATFKAWAVYKLQLSKVDTGLKSPKWPSVPES